MYHVFQVDSQVTSLHTTPQPSAHVVVHRLPMALLFYQDQYLVLLFHALLQSHVNPPMDQLVVVMLPVQVT